MTRTPRSAALALAALLTATAAPQVLAHEDIFVSLDAPGAGGTIILDGYADITEAIKPGRKLFEAHFESIFTPFTTDDPGFNGGGFIGGSVIGYVVLDTLMKWEGTTWATSGFDEFLILENKGPGADVSVSALSGTGGSGLIGQTSGGGGLHAHIDFTIGKTGGGTPDDGAYLLELALFGLQNDLSTPVYNDSAPFLLAFHLNFGGTFDEDAFEGALAALTTPIPLPPAVWLLGSAVVLIGGHVRRRAT